MQVIPRADWHLAATDWVSEKSQEYGAQSICLPAGNTAIRLFDYWTQQPPESLRNKSLHQLDEVGRRFALFFRRYLPRYQVLPPHEDMRPDLAILGLGYNGHVAFHEPGIPASFRYGKVTLLPETAHRLGVEPGTEAWTIGVGALTEAKALLLIILGAEKWGIFQQAYSDQRLPAHWLLPHPDLTILTDQTW
ncbi:hypothetical protein FJY93_02180 [Candidatus Kaiserbacteria bacterium]|nr:hypothetical protein [Candidatus Kaiserbacteria bacterium]